MRQNIVLETHGQRIEKRDDPTKEKEKKDKRAFFVIASDTYTQK